MQHQASWLTFKGNCVPEHVSILAEILVLAGTAAAGRVAPPASTRISAMMIMCSGTQFTREHGMCDCAAGLLEMVYMDDEENREKFNLMVADGRRLVR